MEQEPKPVFFFFKKRSNNLKNQGKEFVCSIRQYFVKEERHGGLLIGTEKVIDHCSSTICSLKFNVFLSGFEESGIHNFQAVYNSILTKFMMIIIIL